MPNDVKSVAKQNSYIRFDDGAVHYPVHFRGLLQAHGLVAGSGERHKNASILMVLTILEPLSPSSNY